MNEIERQMQAVKLRDQAATIAALRAEMGELKSALATFCLYGCPACGGDCGSANPPVIGCPMLAARAALKEPK